jgi:signal transduction histidine kinase/CheY-like chemotaxis protein
MFVFGQKRLKRLPHIVAIVMLGLIYYGTAELSRHVASTPQSVTPVWPPDGFASAAILIFGNQLLAGVLVGSFLANIWAFFNADTWYIAIASIIQVLGIAIGTTIGTGVGNYLLRLSIKSRNPFRRLPDVYKFLAFTGVLAPMINATVGVVCLCLGGKVSWSIFGSVWLTWWTSNVAGICIFTPAIVSWHELYIKFIKNNSNLFIYLQTKLKQIRLEIALEAIVLIVITVGISFVSFYQSYPISYTLLACLIWSVVRFGRFLATNLIVVISTIAVLGTVGGYSSFSVYHPQYSLILLQYFIVIIILSTLSLIAILSENQRAIANLQDSKLRLTNKSTQLRNNQSILNKNALILAQQNDTLMEAQKVAESANKIKSQFISNMSHELRTPLNAILGLTQVLQTSEGLNLLEKSDLNTVYQSGLYLLSLIDDLLDIAKIESGKMELHPQNVDFLQFLKNIADVIQVQANQKSIDFVCQFSSDLPQLIYTDSKRLRQILLNLLNNAIKFTQEGNVIFRVNCNQLKDSKSEITNTLTSIKFEVEDSGVGIAHDQLESIFLPFEQAAETKFKIQGTGLGLAISQQIAGMMGSKINVESQFGVGTTFGFTVCFQVVKSQVLQPRNLAVNIKSNSNSFKFDEDLAQKLPLNILLAEDNHINQLLMTKILNRLGYKLDIANNGLKVLEVIQNKSYDVIFMDMQMPEMDGIETTKCIINNADLAQRPYIIALTANAMDSDRQICLEAGMDDFMSKPINVDSLVKALWRSPLGRQVADNGGQRG